MISELIIHYEIDKNYVENDGSDNKDDDRWEVRSEMDTNRSRQSSRGHLNI